MTRSTIVAFSLAACLVAGAGRAQNPPKSPDEAELRVHLEDLQRRIDDRTIDVATRERLAMEMAGSLDRAAQVAPSAEIRRKRWADAVELLDRFRLRNPGHSMRRVFEVQAAVYLWATGRSWVTPERVSLADDQSRAFAVADLKNALDRLLRVVSSYGTSVELQAQNARYRLAQTLADLAVLESDDPKERRARNEEALAALGKNRPEVSLQGYWSLLEGQLLVRLDRLNEAEAERELSASSSPPPSERELLDLRLDILTGKRQFGEARKAIDASKLDRPSKLARRVKVGLADRASQGAGPDRVAAESALFADLKALRDAGGPDVRTALIAAAVAIPVPGAEQGVDAWEVLADGAVAQGNPDRAGDLALKGAELAASRDDPARAAALRIKAGAALFQAGRFVDADAPLASVARDPKAGALRPRAAMLSALARGRALATNVQGVTPFEYEQALRYVVQNFPDDPNAGEARWLLGKLRIAGGDREGALKLWGDVPHGSARWTDTILETVKLYEEDFQNLRLSGDLDAILRRLDEARAYLDQRTKQAAGDYEINDLRLLRARLELTTGAGKPELARALAEQVIKAVGRDDQRTVARGIQIVALALLGRYVEAEQEAIREAATPPADPEATLELLRLLDRADTEADTDLKARRLGLLMSTLVRPLTKQAGTLPAAVQAEVKLREIRGTLFSGGTEAARRLIKGLDASALVSNPALLRDLADTYTRLEAYDLAADVHRLRMRQLASGSHPWLDARYGLALAYYRGGHPRDAQQLIDATAILHPELGGGALKDRFIRLRQRLGTPDGP